ncbi:MAG: AraC family transcriptional regulator [Ruminococcaceae bacterium]|nr:AraC family transcriptional regulator [Oscillospiraceae bacterium]
MRYNKFPESDPFYFDRRSYLKKRGSAPGPRHYHNFFEVYYIENGYCNYFIDNKAYKLEEGDLVLIPEGIIHNTLYWENSESTRLLINCTRKYIPKSAEFIFAKKNYFYRNRGIKEKLYELLLKIEAEYNNPDEFSDDLIKSYMTTFFMLMARNENEYSEKNSKTGYIQSAIDYIQENLSEEISLQDMANRFSVSREHFSRRFKKETGFGFCDYVNLLRMKKAETLLKQMDNISVAKVATQCGFSDSNYFSVKFKKMYNISPKAVQKMSRE